MRIHDKLVLMTAMAVPLLLVGLGWLVLGSWSSEAGQRLTAEPSATAQPTAEPTTETAGVPIARPTPRTAGSDSSGSAAEATSQARSRAGPGATPAPSEAAASDSGPSAAVASFYELVGRHQFDAAVQLWSPRMQATYPPDENIAGRFQQTQAITLQRLQTESQTESRAVVLTDLVESTASGPRRYVGRWHLVRAGSGWLLDQPELRSAP